MYFQKVIRFYARHKEEFILGFILTVISVGIQPIIDHQGFTSKDKLFVMLGIAIIFLFLLNLFNIRNLFNKRFKEMNRRIFDEFCLFATEDKFFKRLNHWSVEKKKTAKFFARKVLPGIINKIFDDHKELLKLNIILDSGTTITPIFKYMIDYDYLYKTHKDKLKIYTNNLSGISEIYKHELLEDSLFSDYDFNLLGGQPLNKYRATTGKETEDSLKVIKKNQDENNGLIPGEKRIIAKPEYKEFTIGIVTANWFHITRDYSTISLYASGRGHYTFKKELIDNICDLVILISPLGKLLPLEDINELNELSSSEYNPIHIPFENKDRTLLLTTCRPHQSISPLEIHSRNLEDKENSNTKNYVKWEKLIPYKPSGKESEVESIELPHGYIRKKSEHVYNYKKN